MATDDVKRAGLAAAVLGLTVAINLLVLQGRHSGLIETSALAPRALQDVSQARRVSDLGPAMAVDASPVLVVPPRAALAPVTTNAAEITRGIQRELNTRGYEAGQPDGVAGLVTRAAIMAYEHDFGLTLTATPSQELLSRIVLGTSASQGARASANTTGEATSVVRSVEQQLSALGYVPGKTDGKLDEQSARAIREFELDQKLPDSGRISGPLVSRLIHLQGQGGAAPVRLKTKSAQK